MIFAKEEKSFNVQALVDRLKDTKNVETYVLEGKHGFADPFSKNYLKESEEKSKILVEEFIKIL